MQAIITGDIINSTSLNTLQRQQLEQLLWKLLPGLAISRNDFNIQRGDNFQLRVEPVDALAAAIKLRCHLKKQFRDRKPPLDARLAIGLGEISLQGRTLSSSDGTAFRYSGRQLERLKQEKINLAVTSKDPILNAAWEALAILMDEHISSWNHLQAEAVLGRLQAYTFEEIGKQLGINPSAVYKRIESAHWKSVASGLDFYQRWVGNLTETN